MNQPRHNPAPGRADYPLAEREHSYLWVLLGLAAQALFTMRFLVQWIAS